MKNFKDIYMYVMGAIVVLSLIAVVIVLIWKPIPDINKDILYIAAGIIFGWGSLVIGYFFGSSKGSADKTAIIANSTPNTPI